MEIEIGDIVIAAPKPEIVADEHVTLMALGRPRREVRASFRCLGTGAEGTANLGLMMEYHPELEVHADAIVHYMKQEARRLFGE